MAACIPLLESRQHTATDVFTRERWQYNPLGQSYEERIALHHHQIRHCHKHSDIPFLVDEQDMNHKSKEEADNGAYVSARRICTPRSQ